MPNSLTIPEVKDSIYVKNLPEIAKEYGVYGRFVEIKNNPNDELNGVFFVFGSNEQIVFDKNIDINSIMHDNARDKLFFNRECAVRKLTDHSDVAVHNDVIVALRHMEFLNRMEIEFKINLPSKICLDNLIYMRKLYGNMIAPGADCNVQSTSKEAIRCAMIAEVNLHNKDNERYKALQYFNNGYYDITRGKVYNWFRKHFVTYKNCVSLEHLGAVAISELGRHAISLKHVKALKKELNKHPRILYNISEVIGRGVGERDLDGTEDTRMVRLTYDTEYERDVAGIISRVCYPEAFKTSLEELISRHGQLIVIGVSKGDYRNFANLFMANSVPFCIDNAYTTQTDNMLNIVVPAQHKNLVRQICDRICSETKGLRMASFEAPAQQRQLPEQSPQETLETKLANIVSDRIGSGDYTVIAGNKLHELLE